MKQKNKGITLIALVITIIVLLILAGVAISTLTGDNGILTKAVTAKKNTENASAKERIQIEVLGSYEGNGTLDVDTLKSNISAHIPEAVVEGDTFPITVTLDGQTFTVDAEGNVESAGPTATVTDVKVVSNANGTGNDSDIAADSQTEGTELYISFKASIQDGTIKTVTCDNGTVTKVGDLWVTKITNNGTYKFTIVGTVDGEDWTTIYSKKVDKYAKRAGIKVGDYINYEPDSTSQTTYSKDNLVQDITGSTSNTADITRDNLKWQVLRIHDDGSMDLIGSPTSQNIYFSDATGYNNGVYVMHDICEKLYSRNGIKARSVTLEDMESWLTDAGKTAKSNYISNQVSGLSASSYIEKVNTENNTVTYKKSYSYYPNLYASENGSGINTETVKTDGIKDTNKAELDKTTRSTTEKSYKQADNLTTTQTYYYIPINSTNYGDGSKALYNSTYFWVASRSVFCGSNNAFFGLRFANTSMDGYGMFGSSNTSFNIYDRLRPVVSLGSEVQVTASSTASSSTGTPHTITQY